MSQLKDLPGYPPPAPGLFRGTIGCVWAPGFLFDGRLSFALCPLSRLGSVALRGLPDPHLALGVGTALRPRVDGANDRQNAELHGVGELRPGPDNSSQVSRELLRVARRRVPFMCWGICWGQRRRARNLIAAKRFCHRLAVS